MARPQRSYVCQACGAIHTKWLGQCPACQGWNTLSEEVTADQAPAHAITALARRGQALTFTKLNADVTDVARIGSGMGELDRALGGGIVPGSAMLVGGEPGIGKSTLLLQVAAGLAIAGRKAVYISGEEAVAQVQLRAQRLGLAHAPVALAAETHIETIIASLEADGAPAVLIADSVQTLWSERIEAAPGTVSQVRASAQMLVSYAKKRGTALFLVGHVTKDGQIAGPKVVEHIVDTVLYFEGDRGHRFRLLRAMKNRFGPTDEIAVFEMRGAGLAEVRNPSEIFLGERHSDTPGATVFAGLEGTRPVLVEIQALVAPAPYGTPRRTALGFDANRLGMLLAVLEARCGVRLGDQDVFVSVAGGLRIAEPAADLAIATAIVSALSGQPAPADQVFFGEVALSGSIRAVAQGAARLKEAERLGFKGGHGPAIPEAKADGASALPYRVVSSLSELIALLFSDKPSGKSRPRAPK